MNKLSTLGYRITSSVRGIYPPDPVWHSRGENYSSFTLHSRSRWIAITDDGQTIVCWHPEPQHPYECTKPLPVSDPQLKEGDSVLKIQYRMEDQNRFRQDGPTKRELQALTFTSKYSWLPTPGKRYIKRNPPKDRDGL